MEIRKLNHNTYDIFLFNGWENHTRVRCSKRGVYVLDGKRISHALLKHLSSILVRGFRPVIGKEYSIADLGVVQ